MNSDFHTAIQEWRTKPFVWGKNDCCLGAANVYLKLYGKDYAEEWRGYTTALGAYRHLKKAGGMEGIMNKLGFVEVPVNFARRGDIVIYPTNPTGPSMGIMLENTALFAGNVSVPRKMLSKAFRKN